MWLWVCHTLAPRVDAYIFGFSLYGRVTRLSSSLHFFIFGRNSCGIKVLTATDGFVALSMSKSDDEGMYATRRA